jgi:hypothetical protein
MHINLNLYMYVYVFIHILAYTGKYYKNNTNYKYIHLNYYRSIKFLRILWTMRTPSRPPEIT